MKASGEDCPLKLGIDVSRVEWEYDGAGEIVNLRGRNGKGQVVKEVLDAEKIHASGVVGWVHDLLTTIAHVFRYRKVFFEFMTDGSIEQLKRLQNGGPGAHE